MVLHLADANIIVCNWVFTLKYYPYITIAHYKSCLVVRGFTQAYGCPWLHPSIWLLVWFLLATPMHMVACLFAHGCTHMFSPIYISLLFVCSSLSPSIKHGLSISYIFLIPFLMVISRIKFLWTYLSRMLLRGSHPRCVSCDKLFMGTSRVHVLGLPSSTIFCFCLASHFAPPIPPCSLRRLRAILSFL